MSKVPVELRLYDRPEYAAVARMVRYETLNYEDAKPYIEQLEQRFGAGKVREALLDVCLVNWHEKPVTIHLRPKIRPHCFQLLGPAPDQEDWFYTNNDGSPRPRPPKKLPDALAAKNGTLEAEPTSAVKKRPQAKKPRAKKTV